MRSIVLRLMTGTLALALAAIMVPAAATGPAGATEIRVVVNSVPITSYDIQRRQAFLRLQQQGATVQRATDEMIDQTLRMQEVARLNIRISEDQVSDAYNNFARSNNLTASQLDQILSQAGVTRAHFRDYIRSQMGWGQALQARARHEGSQMSEQDAVRRMLEQGGTKPSATEYMLQQVIFVVPAAERGARLAQRRREAEALRARFQSCETTREFARGLIDVTVRDLGRILEPQLPPDWERQIKAIGPGQATVVRDTERGAEFIAICSARQVSDDMAAAMVLESQQAGDATSDELSRRYMTELRERSTIVRR